ncbi:hypothetical protein DRJ48_05080, partial [Candidatus Woesearchaeota archaeon]
MLESSFIILERVGPKLERSIWQQGIVTWNHFLRSERIRGISPKRKSYYNRMLLLARSALNNYNSEYFAEILPKSEVWRCYNAFKEDAVYLDIETSGKYTDITVIGLFDGIRTMTMIKGINLDIRLLKKHLRKYKMIVTYNGLTFDSVVLERYYPNLLPKVPHFDLRFACERLGLKGGLKAVERRLGIKRAEIVEDMLGEDAVYLWNAYINTGNRRHLHKLVAYNEEDTINLKAIAEY